MRDIYTCCIDWREKKMAPNHGGSPRVKWKNYRRGVENFVLDFDGKVVEAIPVKEPGKVYINPAFWGKVYMNS